jgi:hypothetical protein
LHDSAALNARQCREACGLRAKNEPLTTNATLQRTARTTKPEDATCANARKARRTTKRTKDDNAGQPETTCLAQPMRSQKWRTRHNDKRMLLCRLTLELSGARFSRVRLDDGLGRN